MRTMLFIVRGDTWSTSRSLGRMEQRPEYIEFGARIRELRLARHMSQERLAEVAGLDRSYMSHVETGRRNVTLMTIRRLAVALKVEPSVLLVPRGSGD
jgi:DNA-binding XRE family transcriptional regulator